jgi:predicted dehydrogenase
MTSPGRRNESERIDLAIVGTGQISHRYLKQVASSGRARFIATCARTLDAARARAVEYGIGAWFDDYSAMYEAVQPDAVVIATPTAMHAAPTIAALERGIHVLCEKPMGSTFEECRAMLDAARKSGAVYLNLPYDDSLQLRAALAHLDEATLGVFVGAEAQLLLPGPPRANWFYDRKLAGGGAGLDTLVYPVSRLVSLLGPARRVTGFVNTLIPHRLLGEDETFGEIPPRDSTHRVESTVDDNVTLLIEWAGGQQAVVRALWATSIVRNDTTIYGRRGTLWLSGEEVIIHSPERAIPEAAPMSWCGYADCYRIPFESAADWPRNEGLIEHFVDVIEGKSQPTCSAEQALHVHEILFQGYDAASSGCTQELRTAFTSWHRIDPAFHDTRSRSI